MSAVESESVELVATNNKRKRNVTMDLLETAIFMSCRMGTTAKYNDIIKKVRASRERQKNRHRKTKRPALSNSNKNRNTNIAKETIAFSTRLNRNVINTREFYGAVPVVYKKEQVSGYTKNRVICMTPIREHEPLRLTVIHFPMYYTMTDYEKYNKRQYTRKFYNRKKFFKNK